jgi:CxxC-x17-CxxC domain-containing protein
MAAVVDKMQQQLVVLERKIDTLIARSSERPFGLSNAPRAVSPQAVFTPPRRENLHNDPPQRHNNSFAQRMMHKAVCADCKKSCEVPFRPSGERPVYCKECFAKRKSGHSGHVRAEAVKAPAQPAAAAQGSRIIKAVKTSKKKAQKRPKKK